MIKVHVEDALGGGGYLGLKGTQGCKVVIVDSLKHPSFAHTPRASLILLLERSGYEVLDQVMSS